MPHYFPHERLEVYATALAFARHAAALVDSWPASFAVCDHLDRAAESIVINLAKASRQQAIQNRLHCLEISLYRSRLALARLTATQRGALRPRAPRWVAVKR